MERRILNIQLSDRTSNVDLRKKTGMQDAAIQAQQLKWRWAGHTVRMHQGRWTYTTTTWDPREGERNRGRPRCRWSDDFTRSIGSEWSRIGRNRVLWKKIRKTFYRC